MAGLITPFVKRMRINGGTIYTFSSAIEDIGININERLNKATLSHFALLNIPNMNNAKHLDKVDTNNFNVNDINGAFEYYSQDHNIKDGRVLIAESFQNYALNLETALLNLPTYNPVAEATISERVFWKWLKETGAIRWDYNSQVSRWKETTNSNYNSVVQCVGHIGATNFKYGNTGYNIYNETYALVPTSYGKTNVYFKQIEDNNYHHNMIIPVGYDNIMGRDGYVGEHPDALSYKAYFDFVNDGAPIPGGSYVKQYWDNGNWINGWWYDKENIQKIPSKSYLTDSSSYLDSKVYDTTLQFTGGPKESAFIRSNVDCMSLSLDRQELLDILDITNPENIANLNTIFDEIANTFATANEFPFNALLIYYTTYTKEKDDIIPLATNLLGVLFLDAPQGNTSTDLITIPSLNKIKSTIDGFGTSYSFRINIKSDNMVDDTSSPIYDDSTSDQIVLEDFATIFNLLGEAIGKLNSNSTVISYISEQYTGIKSNEQALQNKIDELDKKITDTGLNISGDKFSIPMFASNNSLTSSPAKLDQYKNIYIPSLAISSVYDINGKRILAIDGSKYSLGNQDGKNSFLFYNGSPNPDIIYQDSSIVFNVPIYNDNLFTKKGDRYITEQFVISTHDQINNNIKAINASITGINDNLNNNNFALKTLSEAAVKNSSLGPAFYWNGSKLDINVEHAGGGSSAVSAIENNFDGYMIAATGGSIISAKSEVQIKPDGFLVNTNARLNKSLYFDSSASLGNKFTGYLITYDISTGKVSYRVDPNASGTVQSVKLNMTDNGMFDVSILDANINPVINIKYKPQTRNSVLIAPDINDGIPTFRVLNSNDLIMHNEFRGLQGGDSNNYFHISESQFNALHGAVTRSTNSGLKLNGQEIGLGLPSEVNPTTDNTITDQSHTHKLTGIQPAITSSEPLSIDKGGTGFSFNAGNTPLGSLIICNSSIFSSVNPGSTDGAVLINRVNNSPVWSGKLRYDSANNIWRYDSSINLGGKGLENVIIYANSITSAGNIECQNTLATNIIKANLDASGITVVDSANTKMFKFSITDGFFHAKGDIVSYSTSIASDIRIKENIKSIEDNNIIDQFNVVEFNYIGNSKKHYGLIAQEVEKIDKNLVNTSDSNLFDEEIEDFKSINYNEIIALLIKQNQTLSKRVDELEKLIKSSK